MDKEFKLEDNEIPSAERTHELLDLAREIVLKSRTAKEHLDTYIHKYYFFSIVNIDIDQDYWLPGEIGYISVLKFPITDSGILHSFSGKKALTLVNYLGAVKTQICLRVDKFDGIDEAKQYARCLVDLISIYSYNEVLLLAVSEKPWDALDADTGGKSKLIILDSAPNVYNFHRNKILTDCFDWVAVNIDIYASLVNNDSFKLSVHSYINSHHTNIERLMLANVWLGIEGFMGISQELTFRLSLMIAFYISDEPNERKEIFLEVKRQYGIRSKAVHGTSVSREKILESYLYSRSILRSIIMKCIEHKKVPSQSDFEDKIFASKV